MTAIILWVGGLACLAGVTALTAWSFRLWLREQQADAWDYGYNTRGYDTITGVASPNPYTNGQYPVVDPSTATEPCHVPGCRKHVDGMHVNNQGEAIAHTPFGCDTCEQSEQLGGVVREAQNDILIRVAAALKGDPHPLTIHDHADLPDVAYSINVSPKCEGRSDDGYRCTLMFPHAGMHRDSRGRSWPNMQGFTGTTTKGQTA